MGKIQRQREGSSSMRSANGREDNNTSEANEAKAVKKSLGEA